MKAAEKAVRDILCISDEYEQTLFNYRERGGDRPKGMEYFKREVEVVKQYAAEVSREKLRDAFEQGYDHHNDPNKYYGFDEWMSKQQNNG